MAVCLIATLAVILREKGRRMSGAAEAGVTSAAFVFIIVVSVLSCFAIVHIWAAATATIWDAALTGGVLVVLCFLSCGVVWVLDRGGSPCA